MNDFLEYNELYHHGILGQRWGVRRYQNADGSYTPAGKKRYMTDNTKSEKPNKITGHNGYDVKDFATKGERTGKITSSGKTSYDIKKNDNVKYENSNKQHNTLTDEQKKDIAKKVAIGVGTTAAVAGAVYLSKNPKAREAFVKGAEATGKVLGKSTGIAAAKVGEGAKVVAKETGKGIIKGVSEGSQAATTAALATVGLYTINKVSKKYSAPEGATDEQKLKSDLIVNAASAGIGKATKATKANTSNSNNNNNSGKANTIAKNIESVGKPSKNYVDIHGDSYPKLFKDEDGNMFDDDTRTAIKSMAKAGYDESQIRQYTDMYGKIKKNN